MKTGFRLVAWVLMPEHVHVILVPAAGFPVPSIMSRIKGPLAEKVIARWRETKAPVLDRIMDNRGHARFWQRGGGFDRNIRDEDELGREIGYIHFNPVKRGLVESPIDRAWSSARWYAGKREDELGIDLPGGRPSEEYLRLEATTERYRNGNVAAGGAA